MAGGIIIRVQAAIDAAAQDAQLTAKQKARIVRQLAHQYTSSAHNLIARKWFELKALFGSH